jgi:hypothetical protein
MVVLPRDTTASVVPTGISDSNGRFELKLPPLTRGFDLVVQAPGFALATGRVQVQDDKRLTITVGQMGGNLAVEIPAGMEAVIRHDGAELPLRWLALRASGTFEVGEGWAIANLPNVEPGAYTICGGGRCQSGDLAPNGNTLISLR